MRCISINKINEGMLMGKNVYNDDGRLIKRGNSILTEREINRFKELGYVELYIEDELSKGIYPTEQVSEEMKHKAQKCIQDMFDDKAMKNPHIVQANLERTAKKVVKELIENKQLLGNMASLKTYDNYTYMHSVNVGIISGFIGVELGLTEEQVYEVTVAGLLHDVGKRFIEHEIINKPGKLTNDEFKKIKKHPKMGYTYIKDSFNSIPRIYVGILMHHENYDGTGYPLKKTKDKISLYGRIIRIADTYDALTSHRSYRKAYPPSEAVECIMAESGRLFDPEIVQAFIKKVQIFPAGTEVVLSNGETAVVMQNYESLPLRPKVITEKDGKILDLNNDRECHSITIQANADGNNSLIKEPKNA